jgi:guanine deaminase
VNEIQWVLELHPECETYASVYEQFGLLSPNTYMAHCCHSPKEEREVLKRNQSSVVHCASSNFMLNSGVMDVKLFLAEGIKVALGTDVAGGFSPSMLDAMRQTIIASRVKGFDHRQRAQQTKSNTPVTPSSPSLSSENEDNSSLASSSEDNAFSSAMYSSLNYLEAFHLATVGGAEVLGMDEVVGNFLPGKKLDCLVVDVNADNTPIDVFDHESVLEHFQKFLFLGDDRNIVHVFVDGKEVI